MRPLLSLSWALVACHGAAPADSASHGATDGAVAPITTVDPGASRYVGDLWVLQATDRVPAQFGIQGGFWAGGLDETAETLVTAADGPDTCDLYQAGDVLPASDSQALDAGTLRVTLDGATFFEGDPVDVLGALLYSATDTDLHWGAEVGASLEGGDGIPGFDYPHLGVLPTSDLLPVTPLTTETHLPGDEPVTLTWSSPEAGEVQLTLESPDDPNSARCSLEDDGSWTIPTEVIAWIFGDPQRYAYAVFSLHRGPPHGFFPLGDGWVDLEIGLDVRGAFILDLPTAPPTSGAAARLPPVDTRGDAVDWASMAEPE
jgi:hypothetical protein